MRVILNSQKTKAVIRFDSGETVFLNGESWEELKLKIEVLLWELRTERKAA